jgi:hypothetical protein
VNAYDILDRDTTTPEQFIKAFIAELVLADFSSIPPRDPDLQEGFQKVVDLFDARASQMLEQGAPLTQIRPWVDIANELRLSSTGGMENWERALRRAQLTFTQAGNPGYEFIDFLIDKARAQSELDSLSDEQRQVASEALAAFITQVREDE